MNRFCPTCAGHCRVVGDTLTCEACGREHGVQELPAPPDRRVGRKLFGTIAIVALVGVAVWFVAAVWKTAMRSHNEIHCASNIRALGQAILLYAQDNAGHFPPTLAALPEIPRTDCTFTDADGSEVLGYIYIGTGLTTATVKPDQLIAYEPFPDHKRANVLYADGQVDGRTRDELLALLNQTTLQRRHQPQDDR